MSDDRDAGRQLEQRLEQTDAEALTELFGSELLRDPNHPAWQDERFLKWLGAVERERDRAERRLSERAFIRRGEELIVRARARQLGIRRGGARPLTDNPAGAGMLVRPSRLGYGPIPVVEMGIAAGVGRDLWDEPVEAWIEPPPETPEGEYVALKIVGDSMAPLMHTGDTVLVRVGSDLQRDTVIVARHPEDGYVCKRVSRLGRRTIELASLEPGRPPITIPRDARYVVGRVIFVWCHHRG